MPGVFYEIFPDAGSFALVGNPLPDRGIAAAVGSFALSGSSLEFGAANTLMATGGEFVFINEEAQFVRTPPALNAQPAAFLIEAGASSGSRVLSAGSSSFILNALPVEITPPPPIRQWFGPTGTACMCECSCILPHVAISITGSSVFWEVSGADEATLYSQCNTETGTTTPITLTGGAASGSFTLGVGYCSYKIEATNECGTKEEWARNYTLPRCDCLHVDNESPTDWERTPPVVFSISGSSAASGSGFCVAPRTCPTIGFSAEMYCTSVARKFRLTLPTGCFSFNTLIEITITTNWSSNGAQLIVNVASYWYRRGAISSTNYYPTLTEIIPYNTPVPWETGTVFGDIWAKSWWAEVANNAFIGSQLVTKCPEVPIDAAFHTTGGFCRERATTERIDCDPVTCIPDFTVTATWG